MTIELDFNDPLYEVDAPTGRTPERIQRSEISYAKVEKTTLMSRRFDVVYPPLTRLFLFLRIRTADGRYAAPLTNVATADIGISRYQKYRLLQELESAELITLKRRRGCAPTVIINLPG